MKTGHWQWLSRNSKNRGNALKMFVSSFPQLSTLELLSSRPLRRRSEGSSQITSGLRRYWTRPRETTLSWWGKCRKKLTKRRGEIRSTEDWSTRCRRLGWLWKALSSRQWSFKESCRSMLIILSFAIFIEYRLPSTHIFSWSFAALTKTGTKIVPDSFPDWYIWKHSHK